jgi:catalase
MKIEKASILGRGNGGEPHQRPADGDAVGAVLTTNQGVRIADNQNSLTAGVRGPVLLEDFVLREKLFHFNHERIPERIVHARGSAAHGYFEATEDISDLSCAAVFRKGERTPVFTRFSTVIGGPGSVDTVRDVRGFAVKFYTAEGNWDLVGNNIPVFMFAEAMKVPDFVHSVKMEADRGYPQASSAHDTFWDWASLTPESAHMSMWAMSDRTLPRSLRMMEGFGLHTFRLVNAEGKATFVKFHWKPRLGVQSTVWDEAVKLQSADNDFHRRDLWEAIARSDFPEWDFGIQVFDEKFAESLPWDVLDVTKLIPEEMVPVRIVGRMVLDRNPDNFFAETEQVAYCPANIVPGIDFTNDPMLQGRLFSYLDTQKSRLGTTNFHQLPINAPRCPVANFQRDGLMQTAVPKGRANYEPNSLSENGEPGGPRECPASGFRSVVGRIPSGTAEKLRIRPELFADHYSQARLFWRSQTPEEQAHIASSFVFELSKVQLDHVAPRIIASLRNVDDELAGRIADGLGITLPEKAAAAREPVDLAPSHALSILRNVKPGLAGRTVAILFADGSDAKEIEQARNAISEAGAHPVLIAPRVHGTLLSDGTAARADAQLQGTSSCLFDAVALILTEDGAERLARNIGAVQFVQDAFAHLKAIGISEGASFLLERAGIEADEGVLPLDGGFIDAAGRRFHQREPGIRMLA